MFIQKYISQTVIKPRSVRQSLTVHTVSFRQNLSCQCQSLDTIRYCSKFSEYIFRKKHCLPLARKLCFHSSVCAKYLRKLWTDFNDIFKEGCLCARDKPIKFWRGSAFFLRSWIIFQDYLPLADRTQWHFAVYIISQLIKYEIWWNTPNIGNVVTNNSSNFGTVSPCTRHAFYPVLSSLQDSNKNGRTADNGWKYYLIALPSVGNVRTTTLYRHNSSHFLVCWVSWHHVVIWQLIFLTQTWQPQQFVCYIKVHVQQL